MKPIIAISGNQLQPNTGTFAGHPLTYTPHNFVRGLQQADATPLVLPIGSREDAQQYISLVDGLLLTGGYDVNPALYGEEPHAQLQALFPKRDTFEMALIEAALEKQIPILGICRGMQILNVYYGGSLYQDLPSQFEGDLLQHVQVTTFDIPIQQVSLQSDSYLQSLLGEQLWVNTFHHQAIKELGTGVRAVAHASDGLIEAIEVDDDAQGNILGVQWHPELMLEEDEASRKLFTDLVSRSIKANQTV